MNLSKLKLIFSLAMLAGCMFFFSACDKKEGPAPAPGITSFSPNSGLEGDEVIISGQNFSTTASENIVKFNGTSATVKSATATKLTVTVPEGATTGKITISANGQTATSTEDFTVLQSPVISSFSPERGEPGMTITITGENFSTAASENIVEFGDVTAEVLVATATALKVVVPEEAANGKISVTVAEMTAVSENEFTVESASFLLTAEKGIFVEASVRDALGNTYISGRISGGPFTLGDATLNSTVGTAFVAMYNDHQGFVWARQFESAEQSNAASVAVDASGNVYIAGFFIGTAKCGGISLSSAGSKDIFVAKYSSTGQALWAKAAGGNAWDEAKDLTVHPSGDIFITGDIRGTAYFGEKSAEGGAVGMFLARCDSDGNFKNVFGLTSDNSGVVYVNNVAVDATGNIFVAGRFTRTMTVGDEVLTSESLSNDIFVIKYTDNGEVSWAQSEGGTDYERLTALTLDDDGNVYIAGTYNVEFAFGSVQLPVPASEDIFIAKYTAGGSFEWVQTYGGASYDWPWDLAHDGAGTLYSVGSFNETATFGSSTLTSAGGSDVLIARLNASSGEMKDAIQAGGTGDDYANTIDISPYGAVYVSGYFEGTATIGEHTATSTGDYDLFLWKFRP